MRYSVDRTEVEDDKPPIDPTVIERAYRQERARRKRRQEKTKARKRAHLRFYLTMLVLLAATGLIALTVWRETHTLFGI